MTFVDWLRVESQPLMTFLAANEIYLVSFLKNKLETKMLGNQNNL